MRPNILPWKRVSRQTVVAVVVDVAPSCKITLGIWHQNSIFSFNPCGLYGIRFGKSAAALVNLVL